MCPTPSGKPGCVRSKRLALTLLVATQDQRFLRWIEVQTDDVPEFLFELLVIGELEGLPQMRFESVPTPNALHLAADTPASDAMVRVLQRRRPGRACPTCVITCSTVSSGIVPRRPRPRLSRNPSSPSRSNLCDHLFTQTMLTPSASATSCCLISRARRSMILARRWSRRVVVLACTRRCSSCDSRVVNSMMLTGRA